MFLIGTRVQFEHSSTSLTSCSSSGHGFSSSTRVRVSLYVPHRDTGSVRALEYESHFMFLIGTRVQFEHSSTSLTSCSSSIHGFSSSTRVRVSLHVPHRYTGSVRALEYESHFMFLIDTRVQ